MRNASLLLTTVLCLVSAAAKAGPVGYALSIATAYALADPFPNRIDGAFTEPDTGYLEIANTGDSTFTGDLGTIDAQGYGNIVGRIKDMVIRGGENLFPREIEDFLFTHPAIAEVQVVGVPDARYGEELCAWIRLQAGASADEAGIRAWCEARFARHKIPRYIRFVEEFPMTVTGKIQKFLIRKSMVEELGLEAPPTA